VEHSFQTFGEITVIFIEVKYDTGTPQERLDCLAQVIAECDGMILDSLVGMSMS
jgi:hypothetical protein